ncbi:MAG: gfo/Idh/MocA family oxidoreductase, partial [Bacteroidales bacterium]|nr:gfo/Idh/MocA family oxidoreductase [Bacteroidales bacterium]
RFGKPIHPKSVTARVHAITRMPNYDNKGFLKTHYKDTEDFAILHIEFEDGTIADMFASELVLGGTNNWIQVCANNHQTKCNMSHNTAMQTYTPDGNFYNDVYIVEKIETKQGWTPVSPDEGWFLGYQHELEAFYKAIAVGSSVESNSQLAADVMATIYAGYLSAEQKGKEVEVIILK